MSNEHSSSSHAATNSRARRDAAPSSLRAARLAKGLSQAELAALAGLSPGWISLLERTPKFITTRTARQLGEALGVSGEELLP